MKLLTQAHATILKTMRRIGGWRSPTVIGKECGRDKYIASAWACQALKRLMKEGYVVKEVFNARSSSYSLTKAGEVVADDLIAVENS